MFFSQPAHLAKAEELKQSPPKGQPYSVAIPGTEQPGRTRIYRAWNAQKELLTTLDPQVCEKANATNKKRECVWAGKS
jgi:long-chain acyl-CoA synthetase